MIIKNFEQLASSNLRRQLLKIAEQGFEAINTTRAVKAALGLDAKKNLLKVQNKKFLLKKFKRIFVLCFGKAALESSEAIRNILGHRVHRGIAIDVSTRKNGEVNAEGSGNENAWIYFQATHPNVSEQNVSAAKKALEIISDLGEDDLVICSISGGGSAIFEVPYKIDVEFAAQIFKAMTRAGANISELNAVRKHISLVKGGQLAKHFYPATVINLVFSDVPGDDLSVIASGPLVLDKTTTREAQKFLEKFDVLKSLNLAKLDLIETPKENKYFEKISNFLIASPKLALKAMKDQAEELGWDVKIFSDRYEGEAGGLAKEIIRAAKKGQCLLGAGESTVKIIGTGKGGRNQEMALAALGRLGENQALGCFASDGHDFTDCAGALVDAFTLARSRNLNLNYQAYFKNNDSFNFFEAVGDHVITGLTGSNAADFFVLLTEK